MRRGPSLGDQRHADPEFSAQSETGKRAIDQQILIALSQRRTVR